MPGWYSSGPAAASDPGDHRRPPLGMAGQHAPGPRGMADALREAAGAAAAR